MGKISSKNKRKLLFVPIAISAFSFLFTLPYTSKDYSSALNSFKNKELIVLLKEDKNSQDLENELSKIGISYDLLDTYGGIIHGAKIKVNGAHIETIKNLSSVITASYNDTFLVEEEIGDLSKTYTSPLDNDSLKEMNVPSSSKGGEGVLISVVDSSFSLKHKAFTDLDSSIETKVDKSTIDSIVNSGDLVGKFSSSSTYYYNQKVPFYHDYGGTYTVVNDEVVISEDDNVESIASTHGMHVASIATANGEFKGVAPNAQLAFMKVASESKTDNTTQTITTEAILKAVSDAYTIGSDIITMSIGSALTEVMSDEDSAIYEVVERIQEDGVIFTVAAGNEGKGNWENSGIYAYNTVDMVDKGTQGAYALIDGVTPVASSNISTDTHITSEIALNGEVIYGRDQVIDHTTSDGETSYKTQRPMCSLLSDDEASKNFEYVMVPGLGETSDYSGLDVKGKIAIVKRGEITFAEKITNAKNAGAVGIIICNNSTTDSMGYFDLSGTTESNLIPAYSAETSIYDKLGGAEVKEITIGKNLISGYSSEGGSGDGRITPYITAPGSNVAGAVNVNQTGANSYNTYEYMSGTSMATPNYAGSLALILGEQEFKNEEEELSYKKSINLRTMSTASIIKTVTGAPVSVRKQGAGLVNVSNALNSSIYLEGPNGECKVELGNNADIASGLINFNVVIHNENNLTGTYNANLSITAPQTTTVDGAAYDGFLNTKFQTSYQDLIDEYEFSVTLSGESEQVVNVSYEVDKYALISLSEVYLNGVYLEGYLSLTSESSSLIDLSIPYIGFYGDLNSVSCVEPFQFEKEDGKVYESDLLNNLLEVTGANKPNANFSSLICATTGGLNAIPMDSILLSEVDPLVALNSVSTELIDGTYHIYAGGEGLSDTLYIQQFVMRSVKTNKVTLTNESGEVVLVDHMFDAFLGSGDEKYYALNKTIATPDLFSNQFLTASRAYTIIALKDKTPGSDYYFEDGTYDLDFEYTLMDDTVQRLHYVLHIAATSESANLEMVTLVDNTLTFVFDKSVNKVIVGGTSATQGDNYSYSVDLSSLENNTNYIEITNIDYSVLKGKIFSDGDGILFGDNINRNDIVSLRDTETGKYNGHDSITYTLRFTDSSGMRKQFKGSYKVFLFNNDSFADSDIEVYSVSNDQNTLVTSYKEGSTIGADITSQTFMVVSLSGSGSSLSSELVLAISLSIVGVILVAGIIVAVIVIRKNKNKKAE